MNLAEVLAQTAEKYAGKTAIIFEGRPYSFSELDRTINEYAASLTALGVKKGDRVAIQLPKGMEFIFLHFATLALGGITVPLNSSYTPREIEYFITDSESSLFVTDSRGFARARGVLEELAGKVQTLLTDEGPAELPSVARVAGRMEADNWRTYPTDPDDTAMICYTSGTTGRPKGAMITHSNLINNSRALKQVWQWTDSDVLLHTLPLFHIHGLNVALNGGLYCGSTIIMHEKFESRRVWETLAGEKCTMFMGVPTMYHRLMQEWAGYDLSGMRLFISGSAPLSEELFQRFAAATGFRILERYGMTEAQMVTSNPYEPERRIPKSVGYPLPGYEIRIVGEKGEEVPCGHIGEVWMKGGGIFKGYWRMPEASKKSQADGWFKSGDLGYLDPADSRRLYLVGRAKELVISGGYNVYPKEVETVLEQEEAVQEAAVFGLPDPDFGEKVVAAVVPRGGARKVSEQELIAFCKGRLAGYKCPKQVFYIESLPRNVMGKVQKNLLKDRFA